nr:bZIP transcription factor FD-like protein [Paeonia x lemoinei]
MWSSTGGEEERYTSIKKTKGRNRVLLSTSSSSTSSSSPSPFSPSSHLSRNKTMEEVWKDINLSSLPSNEHHQPHTNFRSMILQDFLARPTDALPLQPSSAVGPRLFGTPIPPPATVLSLNSSPEFHFSGPQSHLQISNSDPISNVLSFEGPFDALAAANSSGFSSFGKKRFPEPDNTSVDRRHKRMIKNRESAARSRARKQAYTNELELEVEKLMEENAKLMEQQERLRIAAAAQLPKKHTLHRSSTAPF